MYFASLNKRSFACLFTFRCFLRKYRADKLYVDKRFERKTLEIFTVELALHGLAGYKQSS